MPYLFSIPQEKPKTNEQAGTKSLETKTYQYTGYPFKDRRDFIERSYNNWRNKLLENGHTYEVADSIAGHATVQDALESNFGTSLAASHNNYGGMRVNNKNLQYKTAGDYYEDKYKMFVTKFPQVFETLTDTAYVDSLNSGKYKYAPPKDNPNYRSDYLNMKTARKLLNEMRGKK